MAGEGGGRTPNVYFLSSVLGLKIDLQRDLRLCLASKKNVGYQGPSLRAG